MSRGVAAALACLALGASGASASPLDVRRTPIVVAVERVRGAVVNISTEQRLRQRVPGPAGELFDQFYQDMFEPGSTPKVSVTSLGSGVIIDSSGDILTNYHVVARGLRIRVGLVDGRELFAEVIGTDPESDIAVLHVPGDHLPFAPLGTSADLMIGETAIAIGNPFGLSHSVTSGVISALHRSVRAEGRSFYDFIQTDAAINPGNSGGPLINVNGEVVGINTAIYNEGRGIGFAIPVERANELAEEILQHGEVRQAWLGLSVQNPPDAEPGVLVTDVDPGSPASAAQVHPGDRLMGLDAWSLQDADHFRYLMCAVPIGQRASIELLREGKTNKVDLVAAPYPLDSLTGLLSRRVGLDVAETTRADKGTRRLIPTLVIRSVRSGSPAQHVGLLAGDVVRAVNSLEVSGLVDLKKALQRAHRNGTAVLLIQRGAALEQIEFPL